MPSKQCTFENNVTFYSDKKTTQHEKKPVFVCFRKKKEAIG